MPETGKDTISSKEPTFTEVMIQSKIDLLNEQIEEKIKQVWRLNEVKKKLSINL